MSLDAIVAAIGYHFVETQLLNDALTHPSAGTGRRMGRRTQYERLEFLGDRVLGLVVAEVLYRRFPDENEGALARRHAALVRREALARVALTLGLDRALILSRGEEEGGGRHNPTMLADACEAVLGAVYADGGLAPAAEIIRRCWEPLVAEAATPPKDAKTALQEWAQGLGKPLPVYRVLGIEGPPHDPMFAVEVSVVGLPAVTASGPSKRTAEQAAATALLETVNK